MPKNLDLPKGCESCHGAPFVETEGGAQRCTCQRGRALYELDHTKRTSRAKPGSPANVANLRTVNRAKGRRDAGKAAANDKEPKNADLFSTATKGKA